MDFNPTSSTKSTLIEDNKDLNPEYFQDQNKILSNKNSTLIIMKKNSQESPNQQPETPEISYQSLDSDKKIRDNSGSFILNQEESSPNQKIIHLGDSPAHSFKQSPSEIEQCLLKKRLSSIAEQRESESYHDYLKITKDRLIEEKTVLETSKENISERNSVVYENENYKNNQSPQKKIFDNKFLDMQKLNKSTPIITSDTQVEIYKSLNLDQSTSGMNILKELEYRKNSHDRGMALSFNLDKKSSMAVETNKKLNADDNLSERQKANRSKYKSHKTFQNLNYSSNVTSILKEDPLKKIDQEYEEEEFIDNKIYTDGFVLSMAANPEKLKMRSPIRVKLMEVVQELCTASKAFFTCIYVYKDFINFLFRFLLFI